MSVAPRFLILNPFYKIRGRSAVAVVIFSQSHAIDTGLPMTTLRAINFARTPPEAEPTR
ncbi:MAG: hypothetical protein Q8O63_01735 [Hoeflea sp.]|nr:hypothetical protein [Hoeflea sp.]